MASTKPVAGGYHKSDSHVWLQSVTIASGTAGHPVRGDYLQRERSRWSFFRSSGCC